MISRTVVPRVEFVRRIPYDLEGDHYFDPRIRNVIVLDDLMSTAAKDPTINDLFTDVASSNICIKKFLLEGYICLPSVLTGCRSTGLLNRTR
jgi:hypothetical protein